MKMYLLQLLYLIIFYTFKIQTRINYLNTKFLDVIIKICASIISNNIKKKYVINYTTNVGLLASILYPTGGHTKCLFNLLDSLKFLKSTTIFISNISQTKKNSEIIYEKITTQETFGFIPQKYFFNNVLQIYNTILENPPKVIISFIHPEDVVFATVLRLIQKNTKIKILFFNHASHVPVLGMSFAHKIIECSKTSSKITHEKRGWHNTTIIPLQSCDEKKNVFYSKKEIKMLKKNLGIPSNAYVTISGGASYKFFNTSILNKNKRSEYFDMIKTLLEREKNLYHVILTNLNYRQQKVIEKIFQNKTCKKRLIILNLTPNFEIYFQSADVFIDSFPISSALTEIDLMRNKVPAVVKINTKKPQYSFHEYLPDNYDFMYSSIKEMEFAILFLLHNKQIRENIKISNYSYWKKTYESHQVLKYWLKVIDGEHNGH